MSIPKVKARPVGSIPLKEVSGLARGRDRDGNRIVVAIGDRAALIAWAPLAGGVEDLRWQSADLSHAEGSRIPQEDPQIEGVALDGRMGVVIVQEFPNRAEVIDAVSRSVRAQVVFDVPDLPALADVHASWQDPESSHSEGIVLMRDGHVLLVKEKDPAALLEFGPMGDQPLGLGPWPLRVRRCPTRASAAWAGTRRHRVARRDRRGTPRTPRPLTPPRTLEPTAASGRGLSAASTAIAAATWRVRSRGQASSRQPKRCRRYGSLPVVARHSREGRAWRGAG